MVGARMIVLDAYYRLLPAGMSENDNAAVTQIFNQLDQIAIRHQCSIAIVHHASKGDQSGKSLTDVGSGAGALTRASDTHAVVRPHEEDGCAVLEVVCRSHIQPEAKTIRFEFPLWSVDETLRPEVRLPKNGNDAKADRLDREADEAVLLCLREEVEATMKTVRNITKLSYDRCNRSIWRLQEQGLVQVTKTVKVRGQECEVWAILEPLGDL